MKSDGTKPIRPPTQADIRCIADAIVARFHPKKIILFGSRAYGMPREDSDVDLLVILPFEESGLSMMSRLLMTAHEAAPASFAMDILPRKPEDIEWRYREGDWLLRDAIDKGLVLYEAAA